MFSSNALSAIAIDFRQALLAFERAAKINSLSLLQRTIVDAMFSRLQFIKLTPQRILDCGSGLGYSSERLKKAYPRVSLFSTDFTFGMCVKTAKQKRFLQKQKILCAHPQQFPFKNNSFDLIFSNLILHWCDQRRMVLKEWMRLLKPNGLLLFTTFGLDSLKELQQSWACVDDYQHVHDFADIHEVGNDLMSIGFSNPVLDVNHYQLTYDDPHQLMSALKRQGWHNCHGKRKRSLMGKTALKNMSRAYDAWRLPDNKLPATFEIIFAHAWGQDLQQRQLAKGEEVIIPITAVSGMRQK